jgi:exopolyphosphatase/guanosine-5'-triphosphate,3'-diphosphate pyrophosphatase
MRVATIDIGTNTVLLLVAETRAQALEPLEELATITRLGEGVDKNRALAPAAIERTNACLARYAERVRAWNVDAIAVVGTSAMRDAQGGAEVAACVEQLFRVPARVIAGEEEARVSFAGAVSGLPLQDAVTIFDIGGGSTEVVTGHLGADRRASSIAFAHSFDIGSVRLTERHVRADPPSRAELDEAYRAAREAFATVPPLASKEAPVGVAGTVTTLAAVSMNLATYDAAHVHGHVMKTHDVRAVVDRLAALPLAERRSVPGLEPKRADVIVAGGLVCLALLEHWSAQEVRISDRGVRWGLAIDLVAGTSADKSKRT